MALRLTEGQDFSDHYALLQRISQGDASENWLALDKSSSERVMLHIFAAHLTDEQRTRIEHAVVTARGLVHPNIARIYRLEQGDGLDYLVCQYVRAGSHFIPAQESFVAQWQVLEQLFDTLAFAHNLGIAHGHLHPGNLLLDDQNHLSVTDFGLPNDVQSRGGYRQWLSPQVRDGQKPDRSDDIYSLGYLMYLGLTGKQWQEGEGFRTDSPVPDEVRHLVASMLSPSAYERPRNLAHLRDITRRYILGESDVPLESLGGFSRTTPRIDTSYSARSVASPRESRVMSAPIAFAGFALLILLAGIVFFLLPKATQINTAAPVSRTATASQQPQANNSDTPPQPQLTPLEIAKRKELEKEGNDVATRLLQLQVGLEDVGVQLWAPDRYKKVQDLSTKGDAAYRHSDFRQALDFYKRGVSILEGLKSSVPQVRGQNLKSGASALANGDYQTAIKSYTIVTAIDPADTAASHDLKRAENLHQVLTLIKDGQFLQDEGKLEMARDKFIAARKLDPEWLPAKQHLDAANAAIAKRHFDDAMSVAFTSLGNHQYDKARAAFRRAQKILPHSTEPADGLQQVDIAIRQEKIDTYRREAGSEIHDENWPAAIAAYKQILALDPSLVFANQGLQRATMRLQLQNQINHYIDHPALMASDDELAAARNLLVQAARAQITGPKLQAQMDKLSQLISLARIPITVQLKSDNRTDVTVYRVGHLGKIESTSIELVPGKYTIVGQRSGYRDVQRKLTVLGGEQPKPVYISCTDKI